MTLRAGGVADERGGVADEEDDGVAELLEVAQLAHEDGVAEVEIGRGGVEAGLDAHGLAGGDGLLDALLERSRAGMISATPLVMRSSWSSRDGNVGMVVISV